MESQEDCTLPFYISVWDRHYTFKLKILHCVYFRIHDPNYKSHFVLQISSAPLPVITVGFHVSISTSFPPFLQQLLTFILSMVEPCDSFPFIVRVSEKSH